METKQTYISGNALGSMLCDALGLEKKKIAGITVESYADMSATIFVRYHVTEEDGEKIAALLEPYKLTKKT